MQERHRIEGVVFDMENNPIEGIWVRIYRGTDQLVYDMTDTDGKYDIAFDRGSPITIRYDDRRFQGNVDAVHPAILNGISGSSNHNIGKALYKVGRAYSQEELFEILSAYEYIYFIDVANNVSPDNEVRSRYPGNLRMVKHVDEVTEQRLRQLNELYSDEAG
jgi:hypothetical protein